MQSPHPAHDESPFVTPLATSDEHLSPTAASESSAKMDPLVTQTANRIASVINDFKKELDKRDGTWATAIGSFDLALNTDSSHSYRLSLVPDSDGDEYPVTCTVKVNSEEDKEGATTSDAHKLTRRASDVELEKDLVSRKRKLDDGEGVSSKRPRVDYGDDDLPLISKADLEDFLYKLREDVQEDTSECVNHVQKLLVRFKNEWHDRCDYEDSVRQPRAPVRDSGAGNGAPPTASFPSPSADRDDRNTSVSDLVRRESKLLSSQIRWVEECRRVAADIHDKKEENWRTSSAGFHDQNRQDRERFQASMLNESSLQGRMLNQILNEVKTIGLYAQSMKWETPDHLARHPAFPPQPTVPAFPTQPTALASQPQSTTPAAPLPPVPIPRNGPASTRGRGRGGGLVNKR
ncbi:hypothetical protein K491DRAFT_40324 [Lophiostoma macrostomum CBS 122681]|uniref:Uncharacterized protein n=1 Tax=Lophiostoma macrostomum CBS 122681 TaxID=1314788 RepID=A0A6A6TN92_9PLEO|nr:hypothetical protein K491DRAFT_40324 [Lophiostoma macrostomum CBS 122681]